MAMMIDRLRSIASLFELSESFDVVDFLEKGNINRKTYLIITAPPHGHKEYILQQLNPGVFTQPRLVMEAMIRCIEAQRKAVAEGTLQKDEDWQTIRLIPTKEGRPFLEVLEPEGARCWRMTERIGHTRSYRSLRDISEPELRLRVAEQAGRGLALFGVLTAGMDPSRIHCPLPGYRDTGLYYNQLLSVLAGSRTPSDATSYLPEDSVVRQSTLPHFLVHLPQEEYRRRLEDPQLRPYIDLALKHKTFALKLAQALTSGELKTVVVHGDTKLENFLFDSDTGRAKALVDLDTIMPHTWLTDWGDMVRSLVNPAGEREADLNKVDVDMEVFRAAARGYLDRARGIAPRETGLMMDAVPIMALELGVRFLADYVRGDSYFTLEPSDPSELNKTRAMVQFCLFEKLRTRASRFASLNL